MDGLYEFMISSEREASILDHCTWTLIDKILNKSLDYDARILTPESFSSLAPHLDQLVVKILNIDKLSDRHERNLRLDYRRGGCGLASAH